MAHKRPLPYAVVEKAVQSDSDALQQVLSHYKAYIRSLSIRDFNDEHGLKHVFIDETVCSDLQAFLLEKVLTFDLDRH